MEGLESEHHRYSSSHYGELKYMPEDLSTVQVTINDFVQKAWWAYHCVLGYYVGIQEFWVFKYKYLYSYLEPWHKIPMRVYQLSVKWKAFTIAYFKMYSSYSNFPLLSSFLRTKHLLVTRCWDSTNYKVTFWACENLHLGTTAPFRYCSLSWLYGFLNQ